MIYNPKKPDGKMFSCLRKKPYSAARYTLRLNPKPCRAGHIVLRSKPRP